MEGNPPRAPLPAPPPAISEAEPSPGALVLFSSPQPPPSSFFPHFPLRSFWFPEPSEPVETAAWSGFEGSGAVAVVVFEGSSSREWNQGGAGYGFPEDTSAKRRPRQRRRRLFPPATAAASSLRACSPRRHLRPLPPCPRPPRALGEHSPPFPPSLLHPAARARVARTRRRAVLAAAGCPVPSQVQ